MPTLLRVFHFPHVKLSNSRDGVASVDDRRCLSLRFGEDDVDEIFRRGDRGDLFEVILRHIFARCRLSARTPPPLLLRTMISAQYSRQYYFVRSARVFIIVQTLQSRRQRVFSVGFLTFFFSAECLGFI